jgi:exonuclease III
MKVISWNCHCATAKSELWNYLTDQKPDIALLQEVVSMPKVIAETFDVLEMTPVTESGNSQRFKTVILVGGKIRESIDLKVGRDWIDAELEHFKGNLIARRITLSDSTELNVVNLYSPAWCVSEERLKPYDVSDVQLKLSKNVWVADLLWTSLKTKLKEIPGEWIIGGDFNLSETFDSRAGGPRGNREFLDRMAALGLTECLRQYQTRLTPTFRNANNRNVLHQIDHLFVTAGLASQINQCSTGATTEIFDHNLSDHLPIIVEFN